MRVRRSAPSMVPGPNRSNLVSSDASVKTCQTLARHSTPSLTIGIYAKASLHDIKGAVESLPDQPPVAPRTEPRAATGTDAAHINTHPSLRFPYAGDGSGRILSAPVREYRR